MQSGARWRRACEVAGLDPRTVERWRRQEDGGDDGRRGPRTVPANKLSERERERVVEVATSPEFRDESPRQIVPKLADRGSYIASESTFYRVLAEEGMARHREASRPPTHTRPSALTATAPNEVWCWDITYLRSPVRGDFYYLYLIQDLYSRRIVGHRVEEQEVSELSAELVDTTCSHLGIQPDGVFLHSDNGGPMKGATMLATLQRLGIAPSFSRPRVSDDNAYVESLFKTLKYRPSYPRRPFGSIEEARIWVADFVTWFNTEHLHSGINFVTPDDRYFGRDHSILEKRDAVYQRARARHPNRWSRSTRNWTPAPQVVLNSGKRGSVDTATPVPSA